jgi:hypothetical protein
MAYWTLKPLNISEARARLPELARFLARNPANIVLVQHRDLDDRIALITERRLRYLENMIAEMKKQLTRPFTVAGSMSSELGDPELAATLDTLKSEAASASGSKAGGFAS